MDLIIKLTVLVLLFIGLMLNKKYLMYFLIILIFFQNFILLILSPYINESTYKLIQLIKELLVVLAILKKVLTNRYYDKLEVVCLISMLILILCVIFGKGTVMGILSSFRQLYLPFLFVLFAFSLKLSKEQYESIIKFYIIMCIIASIFGFIEMFSSDNFWKVIGINDYVKLQGATDTIYKNRVVPANFYTFDLYTFIGKDIRRMASFLVNPVILGQLLSFGCVFLMFYKNIKIRFKKIFICVLIISTLLTFSKGGIFILVFSSLIFLRNTCEKKTKRKLVINSLIIISILIICFYVIYSYKNSLSTMSHVAGFLENLIRMKSYPFGTGIGSVGYLAQQIGGFETEVSGESFYGTLLGQIGLIGLCIYCLFYKYYIKTFEKFKKINFNLYSLIFGINISLIFVCFFNNAAISFSGCFIFFILSVPPKTKNKEY